MLTLQTIEPQAAVPAVCPRPRALVFVAPSAVAWQACALIAASARRIGPAQSVRPLGFAAAEQPAGLASAERRSGYGAAALLADAANLEADSGTAITMIGMAGVNQQDKQDKQHPTTRRGSVTWRPPH